MEVVNDLLTRLQHVDPLVWAALAAYFAPYAQDLLNRVRDFGRSSNYVIALVVVPALIAGLSGVEHASALAGLHPFLRVVLTATLAAVVSQLKYGLSLKPRQDTLEELTSLRSQLAAPAAVAPRVVLPEVTPEPQALVTPAESGY
jgi:predicted PurR-regulated permease PerM